MTESAGSAEQGHSVYKETGGKLDDSQNRKCHVMRVTEREDQELPHLRITNGSVWAGETVRKVSMHANACTHIPWCSCVPQVYRCSCVGEDVHMSMYSAQASSRLARQLWGAETGLFTGQEITNHTGWPAGPSLCLPELRPQIHPTTHSIFTD